MPSIFTANAGVLVRTSVPATSALVTVDGLDEKLKNGGLLATSLKLDRNQDVQYQKTLAATVYTYAYGEGVGRLQLGGYVFFADCGGNLSSAIEDLNDFYDENNVYDRSEPVYISVGGRAFLTYLETFSIALEENPFNFGAFNLLFSVVPGGAAR